MSKKTQTLLSVLLFLFSINLNAQNLSQLAAKYGFKLGTVISLTSVNNPAYKKMIRDDFNSITASNEFRVSKTIKSFLFIMVVAWRNLQTTG